MRITSWKALATAGLVLAIGGEADAAGKPYVIVTQIRAVDPVVVKPGKPACGKFEVELKNIGNAAALPQKGRRKGYRLELFVSNQPWTPKEPPKLKREWFVGRMKLGNVTAKWTLQKGQKRWFGQHTSDACAPMPKDLRPNTSYYVCAVANRGDKLSDGRDASSARCKEAKTPAKPVKVVFEKDFGEISKSCEAGTADALGSYCRSDVELIAEKSGNLHIDFELTKGPKGTFQIVYYVPGAPKPWTRGPMDPQNPGKGVPAMSVGEKVSFPAWLVSAGARLGFQYHCSLPCDWAGKLRVSQRSQYYK